MPDRGVRRFWAAAFTALASLVTGVLFGVSPAWSIFRNEPAGALRQNARTVRGGAMRFGRVLISTQVALSLVLVIGAAVLVRSLRNLRSVDVGFRRTGVML